MSYFATAFFITTLPATLGRLAELATTTSLVATEVASVLEDAAKIIKRVETIISLLCKVYKLVLEVRVHLQHHRPWLTTVDGEPGSTMVGEDMGLGGTCRADIYRRRFMALYIYVCLYVYWGIKYKDIRWRIRK